MGGSPARSGGEDRARWKNKGGNSKGRDGASAEESVALSQEPSSSQTDRECALSPGNETRRPGPALPGVPSVLRAVLSGGGDGRDSPEFAAVDDVCRGARVMFGVLLDAFDLPVQKEKAG